MFSTFMLQCLGPSSHTPCSSVNTDYYTQWQTSLKGIPDGCTDNRSTFTLLLLPVQVRHQLLICQQGDRASVGSPVRSLPLPHRSCSRAPLSSIREMLLPYPNVKFNVAVEADACQELGGCWGSSECVQWHLSLELCRAPGGLHGWGRVLGDLQAAGGCLKIPARTRFASSHVLPGTVGIQVSAGS